MSWYEDNKELVLQRQKERYENNREKILKYQKEYYQRNKEKVDKRTKEYWRSNTARYLYRIAKTRANKYSVEFTITLDDVIVPEVCPILNVPLQKNTRYAASLDRKDNSKGYVPGNVQVISRKANSMKSDATPEELRQFAQWVIFNG